MKNNPEKTILKKLKYYDLGDFSEMETAWGVLGNFFLNDLMSSVKNRKKYKKRIFFSEAEMDYLLQKFSSKIKIIGLWDYTALIYYFSKEKDKKNFILNEKQLDYLIDQSDVLHYSSDGLPFLVYIKSLHVNGVELTKKQYEKLIENPRSHYLIYISGISNNQQWWKNFLKIHDINNEFSSKQLLDDYYYYKEKNPGLIKTFSSTFNYFMESLLNRENIEKNLNQNLNSTKIKI